MEETAKLAGVDGKCVTANSKIMTTLFPDIIRNQ